MASAFPFILAASILILNDCFGNEDAIVEIESGVRIHGSQMTTLNKRNFFAFRGIPYAEPPLGDFRFKPPVRKQWTQKYFDAREMGPDCIQMDFLMFKIKDLVGQEDCLILNVYTHNVTEPLRSVMVYIYGGAFLMGSSNHYGARRLLDRNVVLVTMNYRLGPFGFLSTMDKASPGNYALLDQTEALKWVNRNIAAFGGDPNKVTIFGQSAGSACVMNHLVSPLSSGLFQRAIAQSGTLLNPWAEQIDPMQHTKSLAKKVGCNKCNLDELVDCLRGISADDLRKATNDINNLGARLLFGPVADGNFHSQLPSKLLRDGRIANKVPFLMGVTKDEGILFAFSVYLRSQQPSDEAIRQLIITTLNLKNEEISNDLVQMVKKQYLTSNDTIDGKRLVQAMGKIIADGMFVTGYYNTASFLQQPGMNFFMYSHDYITNHSILKNSGLKGYNVVAHADDLFYLFDMPLLFPEDSEIPNDEIENNFLDIWTTFAENGYPMEKTANGLVKWTPSTSGNFSIYHMAKKIKMKKFDPNDDWRLDFWLRKVPLVLDKQNRSLKEDL